MNTAIIKKSALFGEVKAVPSKSYAHRILICSAFSDGQVRVNGAGSSADVIATANCLSAMGAKIKTDGNDFIVTPVKRTKNCVFNCGESGSTLRFMLSVAAAAGGEFTFTGEGRLPYRPNGDLIETLASGGVTADGEGLPLKIKGKLKSGNYTIDGGKSSQYATGLLLAAPLIGGDVRIEITGALNSGNYIDVTLDVMKLFGVKVLREGNSFFIEGGQRYFSPKAVTVEGDWSNAAFPLAAGILTGEVKVTGLNAESVQGDRAIIDIFRLFGGDIEYKNGAYIAKKSPLKGAEANVENVIDAAPIISVIAAFAEGKSVISGAGRLKLKESDRLAAIIELVSAVGGKAVTDGETLYIEGRTKEISGGAVSGRNDHRIVMSAAIAGAASGIKVTDIEAVKKSYPAFFADYSGLGGVFDVE